MTFSELLIIYLSLGAPVAVYYLQSQIHLQKSSDAARIILAFLLWPLTLVRIITDADILQPDNTFVESSKADSENDKLVLDILELAKRDLNQSGRGQETAQFREMLERYTGLLSASRNSETGSEYLSEFYIAAGNPDPKLAAVCQSRRAGAKLDLHARAVSAEVRHFFGMLQISDELRAAVAALAVNLEDEATVQMLGGRPDPAARPSQPAGQIRSDEERPQSARAA